MQYLYHLLQGSLAFPSKKIKKDREAQNQEVFQRFNEPIMPNNIRKEKETTRNRRVDALV